MKSTLKLAALAVCAMLLPPAAMAQMGTSLSYNANSGLYNDLSTQSYSDLSTTGSVESTLGYTGSQASTIRPLHAAMVSGPLDGENMFAGEFTVTRFDLRGGQLYAIGMLNGSIVPATMLVDNDFSLGSTPLEPKSWQYELDLSEPTLGLNMPNEAVSGSVGLSGSSSISGSTSLSGSSSISGSTSLTTSGSSSDLSWFDPNGWTGIGTGYGESGPESTVSLSASESELRETSSMSSSLSASGSIGQSASSSLSDNEVVTFSEITIDDNLYLHDTLGVRATSGELVSLEFDGSEATPFVDINAEEDTPFIQLGGSETVSMSETERVMMTSGQMVRVPVESVHTSGDAVTLTLGPVDKGFAAGLTPETITITASDERVDNAIDRIEGIDTAAMTTGEDRAMLAKELNRLISAR